MIYDITKSHRVFAFCAPLLFLCSLGACKSKSVFSTNILCPPSFSDWQTLFLSIRGIEHNILYDGHAGIAQGGDPPISQPQARYNAPLTKIIKNIIAPMPWCHNNDCSKSLLWTWSMQFPIQLIHGQLRIIPYSCPTSSASRETGFQTFRLQAATVLFPNISSASGLPPSYGSR